MAALARRKEMAALARSEHERAARSLPAAALPQRAFSENTTKRDIPTFVRARIREFEAVLPRPFYLWSVRRASRWRHRLASMASPRSFAGGARVRRNSGRVSRRPLLRVAAMDETHKKITKTNKKTQAEKSSHTMRVANADSDWDIHCFYLPRDPAAAWCGVSERHNFEKQVYGPRRTGAPADEPDVELGFHDALRVARLVAKGDQMTLEILLSRPRVRHR